MLKYQNASSVGNVFTFKIYISRKVEVWQLFLTEEGKRNRSEEVV